MVLRRLVLPRSALRASASAVPLSSDCTMRPRLSNSSSTAWWVGTDTMGSPCAMAASSIPWRHNPMSDWSAALQRLNLTITMLSLSVCKGWRFLGLQASP